MICEYRTEKRCLDEENFDSKEDGYKVGGLTVYLPRYKTEVRIQNENSAKMSRKSLGSRCRVLNYSLSDKKVLFAAYRNSKQILLKKTQAAFDLQTLYRKGYKMKS